MILVSCLLMSWFFEKIVIFGFGEMAENHQKLRNIRKFRGILPKFFPKDLTKGGVCVVEWLEVVNCGE